MNVSCACCAAGKGKAKKAKLALSVEPLQDGEELTDMTGKKWKLLRLLSQSATELVYEGEPGQDTKSGLVCGSSHLGSTGEKSRVIIM